MEEDDPEDVERAFQELAMVAERPVPSWANDNKLRLYRLIAHAVDVAWDSDVTLDSLAVYCARFLLQHRGMMKEDGSRQTVRRNGKQ